MQVYWASTFVLPKRMAKEVNNILRCFLWSAVDMKRFGANVSWEDRCFPKSEGVLGMKDVVTWNIAAISKHIWFLIVWGRGPCVVSGSNLTG